MADPTNIPQSIKREGVLRIASERASEVMERMDIRGVSDIKIVKTLELKAIILELLKRDNGGQEFNAKGD
jgi:hypothetical protein